MAVKQITFRVEPEEYEILEAQWKKAGFKKLQEAGLHAFRTAFEVGTDANLPARYRPYLKKLVEILSSGDDLAIKAVVSNLEVFHDRLRPAVRKGH